MNQPALSSEPPSESGRSTGRHTVLKVVYAVMSLPVVLWVAFILYAIAKARYDQTPLGSQVPFLTIALAVPALWLIGSLGSLILARLGRRWTAFAIVMLLPVVLGALWVLSTFVRGA